jgi:flagellar protein FlaJ
MKPGHRLDFWGLAYSFLGQYTSRFERYFADLRDDIMKAGILVSYRGYVAGMFLVSIIGSLGGIIAGAGIALFLNTYIWVKVLIPFGFGLLSGTSVLAGMYFRPKIKAGTRKRRLDEELPYMIGHMAVLASAGLTPEKIFQSIAEEETNDIINQEARMVMRDINLLGMDLTEALEQERKRSPSDSFSEFLDGFIAASKSGADIKTFLVRAAAGMMEDKRVKAKQFGETVGVIAEMYTIVLVVTPLILIIMFAVMGIIAGSLGGINIMVLIMLIAYVMVPLGGTMVMIMADAIMPKG